LFANKAKLRVLGALKEEAAFRSVGSSTPKGTASPFPIVIFTKQERLLCDAASFCQHRGRDATPSPASGLLIANEFNVMAIGGLPASQVLDT